VTLEEVRDEYERIHLRWQSAGRQDREQDFATLQALLRHVKSLADEDSESLEVEIEDLVTQIASRIDRDNRQREAP